MDEPEDTDPEDRTTPQPRSLRVIGWLLLVLGVVSLPGELNRILDDRGVRWVSLLLGIASVAGPVGLLLRTRWGYLVTLGHSLVGIVLVTWVFFIQAEPLLAVRLFGILLVLILAVPVVFLLTPKARRWFKDASPPADDRASAQ